jgi:hypothetical protein
MIKTIKTAGGQILNNYCTRIFEFIGIIVIH